MRIQVRVAGSAGLLALALGLGAAAPLAWAETPSGTGPAAPPAVVGAPAGTGPSAAGVPVPRPAAPAPTIIGFRGARFGMNEADVRAAIAHDFHLPPGAIKAGQNAVERTAILSVQVADLAPGAGRAIVSYVFGYHSHALIEVNIVWSKASDAHLTPEQLALIGQRLRAYFLAEHFPPGQTAADQLLPEGFLLFRTIDPAGRAIALILSGPMSRDVKSGKRVLTPDTLSLAYAADAPHPDVFRLEKGSF